MPVNYMDYVKQVRDPMESVISGYSQGLGIRRQQEEAAKAQAQTQLAQTQQRAVQSEQANTVAMNQELSAAAEDKNLTSEDVRKLVLKYPALSTHFKSVIENLRADELKVAKEDNIFINNAVETGQLDALSAFLDKRIKAAENSGDERAIAGAKALKNTFEANPDSLGLTSKIFLHVAMGDKFSSDLEGFKKESAPSSKQLKELYDPKTKKIKLVNFDPQTGKGMDPDTGEEVRLEGLQIADKGDVTEVYGADGKLLYRTGPADKTKKEKKVETKTAGALEQILTRNLQINDKIQIIRENYSDELLSYKGVAKEALFNVLSNLGLDSPDRTAFLARRRNVKEATSTLFNLVRKDITGAQAAMRELDWLQDSITNMELSPAEFKVSVRALDRYVTRQNKIVTRLLKEGFTLAENQKAFAEKYDEYWKDEKTVEIQARGDQLESEGKTPKEVIAILKEEGYRPAQ